MGKPSGLAISLAGLDARNPAIAEPTVAFSKNSRRDIAVIVASQNGLNKSEPDAMVSQLLDILHSDSYADSPLLALRIKEPYEDVIKLFLGD